MSVIDRSMPLGPGPLRLDTVYCLNLPSSPFGNSPPSPSPDERHYFSFNTIEGLRIGSTRSDAAPKRVDGRFAVASLGYSQSIPFAWAADSKSVLGARQDTLKPSGFATGPVAPMRVPIKGRRQPLPTLSSPAGNLDSLMWVGNAGLALAEFGAKGRYYRPGHDDPHPTIAIVDGRRGTILQSIEINAGTDATSPDRIGGIDARLDGHGKSYAVFSLDPHRWFEWHQGQSPRHLPMTVGNGGILPFAISPDLKNLLIMRGLFASGFVCEHARSCPPLTPETGPIAELRNIKTGIIRWTITRTTTARSPIYKPTISPDGRYALIAVPANGEERETTALISLRDGRIVQQLPDPWAGNRAVGFGKDGNSAWISGGNFLVVYRLARTTDADASGNPK